MSESLPVTAASGVQETRKIGKRRIIKALYFNGIN
jgi:hypothetical protein